MAAALGLALGLGALLAPPNPAEASAPGSPVAASRVEAGRMVVAAASPSLTRPKLTGSIRVGSKLHTNVATTGKKQTRLRYAWLRDGKRIAGEAGVNYRVKKADLKHRISVRVTATFVGGVTLVSTSAKTEKIRPRLIDDPTSGQVVVNKRRPLKPKTFVPLALTMPRGIANNGQPVRPSVARAIEKMHKAARADGVGLRMISGYRSYALQRQTFNAYVARDGVRAAETYSARPGYSEHQTGLTVDLGGYEGCDFDFCFASTKTGKWLKKNAYKYGFIMRYPNGSQKITGYIWEPYHFRYVGTKVAKNMKKKKIQTLEQYRGLKAAPNYG